MSLFGKADVKITSSACVAWGGHVRRPIGLALGFVYLPALLGQEPPRTHHFPACSRASSLTVTCADEYSRYRRIVTTATITTRHISTESLVRTAEPPARYISVVARIMHAP
jgi:hypothetical protein